MLLSLVHFAVRCLLQALAPSGHADFEREVELLVLRHQVKVPARGTRRPPFLRRDRILLAASQAAETSSRLCLKTIIDLAA